MYHVSRSVFMRCVRI